ncbi:PQ loop repeat protein [archaeon BMS3Abin17]|nr:PQ loop repeat protein [archaeon BMS3Abin17]
MLNWITLLGLTAALLTTISSFPQAIKIIKTKKTEDISLLMYIILTIGVFLWLVYGIIIKDIPIISANVITFGIVVSILSLKIRYK